MSDISRDILGSDAPSVPSSASRSGSSAPLNRTCEGCRRRKIKCILPPIGEDAELLGEKQCIRCRKLSIECIFLPPATKKSRRRNEARIRDLERKLDAIQDAVEGTQSTKRSPSSTDVSTTYEPSPLPTSVNQLSSWSVTPAEDDFAGQMNALVDDPITKGFVTYGSAGELYTVFHDQMAPLYPLVLPPPPSTWEDIRVRKPALLRAAIMAASSSQNPKLSETLFQDTEKMLADKIIFKGEKSIELIQALLILSTWYHPPPHFQGLKFSQFAHMAATMVMDLRSSNSSHYDASTWGSETEITEDMIDVSRTFTACFLLCSSMALSLRRPSMLIYGSWVEKHIRVLESLPSSHLSDRRLVAWVRLQILGEDGSKALNLDNDSSESNDISESQVQFILKSCVQRLHTWKRSTPDEVLMKPLEMHYQMIMTSFHEPAFYLEHRPEDFRPPYTLRVLPLQRKSPPQSPSLQDKAFLDCIKSAHHLLQIFLHFDIPTLRALPVIVYTRVAYAIIVLLKSHISIHRNPELSSLSQDPGLEPAQILRPVLDKLLLAAGDHRLRVPTVFYYALSNVARWCTQRLQHGIYDNQEHLIEPMMHLGVEKDANSLSHSIGSQQTRPLDHSSQGSLGTESYLTSPGSISRLAAQPNPATSWINILPDGPTEGAFEDTFDFNFGDAYVP